MIQIAYFLHHFSQKYTHASYVPLPLNRQFVHHWY